MIKRLLHVCLSVNEVCAFTPWIFFIKIWYLEDQTCQTSRSAVCCSFRGKGTQQRPLKAQLPLSSAVTVAPCRSGEELKMNQNAFSATVQRKKYLRECPDQAHMLV